MTLKTPLTFACGAYDRTMPLMTREVTVDGVDLNYIVVDEPREIFDRMAGGEGFDLAEMSLSEYICRYDAKQNPFVALPVFPSRVFRHSMISVNRKTVRAPEDLAGKRVGVPLYTMTAAIFIRGMLEHDYDVDMSKIHWVQGALNHVGSHGQPSAPPLLKKVDIEIADPHRSLNDLIDKGEIDAIIATNLPSCIKTNPDVVRLFPNYREVERDYYKRTGIFPIMHLVAMRRDVHEKYPFAASSLYEALKQSRLRTLSRLRDTGALRYMLPWMTADLDEIDEIFGGDPWPDGIEANRKTLEALVTYLHEQGLIAKKMPIEDIFVKTFESH
jgi:4,5-dihydroxyphthalate decarboxylase